MLIDNIREFIKKKAEEFGAKTVNEFHNDCCFGFIHSEEDNSAGFHDFSLSIFPNEENKPWIICIGVGSEGFKNDAELAIHPGLRRLFSKLVNNRGFCNSNFSDLTTYLPETITLNKEICHLKDGIKKYNKVVHACELVDNPESEEGRKIISSFIAGYSKIRKWAKDDIHRKAVSKALEPFIDEKTDTLKEIKEVLNERKFVVILGPPGTGKTRAAKQVAKNMNAKTFFTQFHAKTSYEDFVYGIKPDLSKRQLTYRESRGILTKALKFAMERPEEKTVLIIDEINRADLAHVIGPVFYLFEYRMKDTNVVIEVCPGLKLSKLPENFYVIGTMNSADRTLAVKDFALRRRFAWYTLKPELIESSEFYKEDFFKIQEIFFWYASNIDLLLQPGQGYFLASSEKEMTNRIRYEVFPLIKEYIQEGLLVEAQEEFNHYFSSRINRSLFE